MTIKAQLTCILALASMLYVSIALAREVPHLSDMPFKINSKIAERLAAEANDGSTKLLKSYDAPDAGDISAPFIDVLEFGLVDIVRNSAVNPWTGAVWDIRACKRIETPASRRERARIHKLFTPTELKDYNRLDAIEPCSEPW